MSSLQQHTQRWEHHRAPTLDQWLKSRSDRCNGCGAHPTQGHTAECAPVAPADEYTVFLHVLREVAVDGVVHQSDVRPKVRGRIEPKHVGLAYRRAIREGVLVQIGHEQSDDVIGGNAGRLEPRYRLRGAA